MKRSRNWISALLICVLMLSLCSKVRAEENPELSAETKLNIHYEYNGINIADTVFYVYRIANMDSEGYFELADDYSDAPVDLSIKPNEGWDSLALTLKNMAAAEGFQPLQKTTTDKDGRASVEGLSAGLYLVVGQKSVFDGYTYYSLPGLVSVPALDQEGKWNYEVTMQPKVEREKNPDDPEGAKTERRVLKVWMGEGDIEKRPKFIEVYLLCNGENVGTAVISEENNWRYDWKDLDKYDKNGSEIEWTVSEKKLDGFDYTVRITQAGTTIMVVNTDKDVGGEHNPPTPVPNTGLLWWPVAVLACAGMLCLIIGIKKRNSE